MAAMQRPAALIRVAPLRGRARRSAVGMGLFLLLGSAAVQRAAETASGRRAAEAAFARWIRGRVLVDGMPRAGAAAALLPRGRGAPPFDGGAPPAGSWSDPAGLFVLRVDGLGPWLVRVELPGGAAFECAVPLLPLVHDLPPLSLATKTGTLDLSAAGESACWRRVDPGALRAPVDSPPATPLDAGGTRRGVVVDALSGRPIAGAWVYGGVGGLERTGDDGSYHVEPDVSGLGADRVLEVAAVGFESRTVPVRAGEPGALRIPLESRSTAEGWVVDEMGRGIADVELSAVPAVTPPEDRVAARRFARTGADGSFRLQDLEPGVLYVLDATAFAAQGSARAATRAGRLREEIRFGAPEPRETRSDLCVELYRKRPAHGWVVTDADGVERPVEGAEVTLGLVGSDTPYTTRTDATGRFDWPHVRWASYELVVRAAGFAPGLVSDLVPPKAAESWEIGTLLLDPGVVLEVRVTRRGTGEPITGARISLREERPNRRGTFLPWRERAARTGADGFARLEDLEDDQRVQLRVGAPGFATAETAEILVPADEPVEVALDPGAEVSGVVLDATGDPLSGAFVRVHPDGELRSLPVDLFQNADEAGRFALAGVPPGIFLVSGRSLGAAEIDPVRIEVVAGRDVTGLVLREPENAPLEGRVRAPEGVPIRDAIVVAAGQLDHSGEDGSFRLERVRLGRQKLEVRREGGGEVERQVDVPPSGAFVEVVLDDRGAAIAGEIVDAAQQPVADLALRIRPEGAGLWRGSGRTDADGRFRIDELAPGEYLLDVGWDATWVLSGQPLRVAASRDPEPARLVVRPSVRIEGTVLGLRDGERASVEARRATDGASTGGSTSLEQDGRFELRGAGPGSWTVTARVHAQTQSLPHGLAIATAVVEIGEHDREVQVDLELERRELEEQFTVRGRAHVDGEPAGGLWLALTADDGLSGGRTDALGRFELCCLEAGRYRLLVGGVDTALVLAGTVEVEGDVELDLPLERTEVSGEVIDGSNGEPVAGATLHVLGPLDPSAPRSTSRATDAQGHFRFPVVMPAGSRLHIDHPEYAALELRLAGAPLTELGAIVLERKPHSAPPP